MATLLQNRTPAQLASIIAASNLLASSGFAVIFVDTYRHSHGHGLSPFAASISFALPTLGGLVLGMFAERALKDGISSEQWPDALLVTTRKIFTHPALPAATLVLMVAAIAVIVSGHFGAAWIFLIPSMGLTRIRAMFSPPRENASGLGLADPPKPIQSEHWGVPHQSLPR